MALWCPLRTVVLMETIKWALVCMWRLVVHLWACCRGVDLQEGSWPRSRPCPLPKAPASKHKRTQGKDRSILWKMSLILQLYTQDDKNVEDVISLKIAFIDHLKIFNHISTNQPKTGTKRIVIIIPGRQIIAGLQQFSCGQSWEVWLHHGLYILTEEPRFPAYRRVPGAGAASHCCWSSQTFPCRRV